MRVFTEEMTLEGIADFLTWIEETHPAVLKQLVDAWKKSKEMKK
tara:strand:- start:471 stop:602 length:132 start_codon:yes stop_codon:yes gene_type:complete